MILMLVVALGLGLVLVLSLWSCWRMERTEGSFAALSRGRSDGSSTVTRAQLEAAAAIAEELNWTREEAVIIDNATSRPYSQWSDEDDTEVASIVERNRAVLSGVASALQSAPPINPASTEIEPPFDPEGALNVGAVSQPLMQTARLAGAAARSAIRFGDPDIAAADLALLKNLAEALQGQQGVVELIVGIAIENILDHALLDLVAANPPLIANQKAFAATLIPRTNVLDAMRTTFIAEAEAMKEKLDSLPSSEQDGFFKRTLSSIITPIVEYRQTAMMVEHLEYILDHLETPFGVDPEAFLNPPEPPWWQLFRRISQLGRSNQLNLIGRGQATAALRHVLKAALAMRAAEWPGGAFPEERPDLPQLTTPDPFTGELLEYRRMPDGGIHLGVVNGPELLEILVPRGNHHWLGPVELTPPV